MAAISPKMRPRTSASYTPVPDLPLCSCHSFCQPPWHILIIINALFPGYLQEHEAKYKQWAKAAGYTLDANLLVTGPVQADPPGKPEAQQTRFVREKIPGGYNGDERFVRLAALKSAALLTQTAGLRSCWPPNTMPGAPGGATNARLTPGYVPKGTLQQQHVG